ncbi:cation-transporting P-type ATPase [Roseibium sediminis]|uniref:cation-transporting P-type ATPase n=1 Tax=Roseibium sediminis TaxID=1775174 RepID=UPI00123CAEE5|nr:cation-transporting P-type ATPase [Roseibium sediminis]
MQAFHAKDVETSLEDLKAERSGLTGDEARRRLDVQGPNRLPHSPRPGWIKRLALQFHNVLIYALICSGTVTLFLGHLVDAAVIFAVVILNAVVGVLQEGKAERAMDAIQNMLAPRAAVLRSAQRMSVAAEDLVPGDIVLLEAGDRVPADLRLVEANNLQIQEAVLTGESVASEKDIGPVAETAALGDRKCIAFSGCLVTTGSGTGVVCATGAQSEIGRINRMLSEVETTTTPLLRQMDRFARWLTLLILTLSVLLFLFGGFVLHYDLTDLFLSIVGLAVAAIPEGLPAVLTITLAVGVQQMAKRNAIVRRLPAIESLGSVSVICTDKTGTLTRNEMVVASAVIGQDTYTVTGEGYGPDGQLLLDGVPVNGGEHEPLRMLGEGALLCNDAHLRQSNGAWHCEGDPMEGALLAFAAKVGLPARQEIDWAQQAVLPVDARHRYMAIRSRNSQGRLQVFVKGAPERLLAMCSHSLKGDGSHVPLDSAYWHRKADEIAAKGQRVLAFALGFAQDDDTPLADETEAGGLVFAGLVGFMDPPRPEAVAAVAECRSAGIDVKMITGDHAVTAAAIGRQVGLANCETVLTGAELDVLSDADLASVVRETDIFARTSPEHKLRLVKALQGHGLTVAMTGDGVNDAPALKRADAGVAMGKGGSEAAREAAQLVLADDNFASIVAAVREGRTVYDNIKKVIAWTLPTSSGAAMTIVIALLMGMTLPITAIQILWVNLITAVTLGLALAFEPTEEGTMARPPRPRDETLMTGRLAWHVVYVSILILAGVFGIYAYAIDKGYDVALARTLALNALVVMEIFHLFNIRNIHGTSLTLKAVRGTPVIWATILIVTIAQFAVTYVPPLQAIFGTQAVSLVDGMIVVGLGIALFVLVELEKQMRFALRRA